MSTDDRDIESSNPSKNFKVGDFDQGSGFFTPVWESKRRIRSEPPAPPSSKGGSNRSAPSSRSPQRRESEPPSAPAVKQAEEEPVRGKAKAAPVPRPRSSSSPPKARSNAPPARAATPVPPAPASEPSASEQPASAALGDAGSSILLPPAVAAVFNPPSFDPRTDPPIDPRSNHPSREPTPALSSAARSEPGVEPAPRARGASPSAAARALRDAGPNLPPAAFLDEEPEFRSSRPGVPRPGRTDRSPVQYRAQRATSAAARVHEQLKAKFQAEAAEIDESRYDMAPETHPNPLQSLEAAEPEPYPLSLLRRLRRTIRLSTPVPDPIRSLISKHDRG